MRRHGVLNADDSPLIVDIPDGREREDVLPLEKVIGDLRAVAVG